ncbi:YjzD family protein [Bacillus thermotolerans]|uniref:DUF2929 domain-containing protein n=1 Tax=Bacillus thermotolerans TaxID=1221996 RepID=A0A0F5HUM9_BACTR|nr:YjzD family protein [Bacillus thermotolerans]KKB36755.1 hypothetical protein QY97_00717 [Bacillus thermotolerans]KKB40800.1 hypothetical protein QY95_01374 [Bacillus thermotolerans]KKB43224.1 hypothetical protein QY96_00929 [Bacillus thermotolerans]
MKYIATFFWTFLLVEMLTYVVSSMNGVEFQFMPAFIISIVTTILILVLSAVIPDGPREQH